MRASYDPKLDDCEPVCVEYAYSYVEFSDPEDETDEELLERLRPASRDIVSAMVQAGEGSAIIRRVSPDRRRTDA